MSSESDDRINIGLKSIKTTKMNLSIQFLIVTNLYFINAKDAFQTICHLFKFGYRCEQGLKSKYLLVPFAFDLNLAQDCGFEGQTIEDVYFKSAADNIFLYSAFDFKLKRLHPSTNGLNLTRPTYTASIPLTEIAALFNNKNIPTIFLYLPANLKHNQTSVETTEQLNVQFGQLHLSSESRKDQMNKLNFSRKSDLGQYCKPLESTLTKKEISLILANRLLNDKWATSSSSSFQSDSAETQLNYASSLNSFSLPTIAKSNDVNDGLEHKQRAHANRVLYKDDGFKAYIQLPLSIKSRLTDDSFIYQQSLVKQNLFLELRFWFENTNSALTDKYVTSLNGR